MKIVYEIEIIKTFYGFMVYDHDCDEYLENINGDNTFDDYQEAVILKLDLEKTRGEQWKLFKYSKMCLMNTLLKRKP